MPVPSSRQRLTQRAQVFKGNEARTHMRTAEERLARVENERDEIEAGGEETQATHAETAPHRKEHPAKHVAGA